MYIGRMFQVFAPDIYTALFPNLCFEIQCLYHCSVMQMLSAIQFSCFAEIFEFWYLTDFYLYFFKYMSASFNCKRFWIFSHRRSFIIGVTWSRLVCFPSLATLAVKFRHYCIEFNCSLTFYSRLYYSSLFGTLLEHWLPVGALVYLVYFYSCRWFYFMTIDC